MSLLYSLTILCKLILTANTVLFAAPSCPKLLSSQIINTNARIQAQNYLQPQNRNIKLYSKFLGPEFTKRVKALGTYQKYQKYQKYKDIWIDVGAGYGIAALQTALKQGNKSIVINSQDFWISNPSNYNWTTRIQQIAESLIWPQPRTSYNTIEIEKKLIEIKNKATQDGHFSYLVGLAEIELPKINERAELLSDLYGAYYYSADRVLLLDQYYKVLKYNGTGFIRLKTRPTLELPEIGPENTVRLKNGQFMNFENYLTKIYPEVFSFDPFEDHVLIIRKNAKYLDINLRNRLALKSYQNVKVKSLDFQDCLFHEL